MIGNKAAQWLDRVAARWGVLKMKNVNELKIQGPIDVELKVGITNGEVQGVATIGMKRGIYPTESELRDRVAQFEQDEMPDGFRLMTKREWWGTVCQPDYDEDEDGKRHAMHFAVPGGDDYDD